MLRRKRTFCQFKGKFISFLRLFLLKHILIRALTFQVCADILYSNLAFRFDVADARNLGLELSKTECCGFSYFMTNWTCSPSAHCCTLKPGLYQHEDIHHIKVLRKKHNSSRKVKLNWEIGPLFSLRACTCVLKTYTPNGSTLIKRDQGNRQVTLNQISSERQKKLVKYLYLWQMRRHNKSRNEKN